MDAEGWVANCCWPAPLGDPWRTSEKQTVGTVAASHKMLTLQALSSTLSSSTTRRGCLGQGWGRQKVFFFAKWGLWPLPKTTGFDDNGDDDEWAFCPQKQGLCSSDPREQRTWRKWWVSRTQDLFAKNPASLNKESRPFFLGDNSISSFPSFSSLSDCSIWFIVPKYYDRLGKREMKESRLLI